MSLQHRSHLSRVPLQEQKNVLLCQTLRTLKVAFLIVLLIAVIALMKVIWKFVAANEKFTYTYERSPSKPILSFGESW